MSHLCATALSPLHLTPTAKRNSLLRLHQKPNHNVVSFSSVRSQARDESDKSALPMFSQLSCRTPTKVVNAVPATAPVSPLTPTKPKQTVEHIVLFKMKEGTDEATMVDAMNSLKCLPGVLYLSSGFVHGIHCSPHDFNIFLHSRHATKDDLDRYMGHRLKYAFTMTYTEPYYHDYMIIDFVHDHDGPLDHPKLGNALRCTFLKMKDGYGENEKKKVLQVIGEALEGSTDQQTFGESYEGSTYRPAHKGYDFGTLAVFPSVKELASLGSPQEFSKKMQIKLQDMVDESVTVFVVDYEINELYDGNRDNL